MDVNIEVEFRRRNIKTVTCGVVAAVLLLGAVVFMAVYFSLSKEKPTRLVEIDLKEGETLTYRVDQHIKIYGSDEQKAPCEQGESRFFLFVFCFVCLFVFFIVHVKNLANRYSKIKASVYRERRGFLRL